MPSIAVLAVEIVEVVVVAVADADLLSAVGDDGPGDRCRQGPDANDGCDCQDGFHVLPL